MELTDRPAQNTDIAMRIIDGTAYLMDPSASDLHALSEVGTRIYELVDGERTVDGIVDQLFEEYDVEREVLEQDTLAFLAELATKGLVVTR